jgi:hypothetical protein
MLAGVLCFFLAPRSFAAQNVKLPNVAGSFYPADKATLDRVIRSDLDRAHPPAIQGHVWGILTPHAGYEFSGPTAAYSYKLIEGKPYKTVVVIGPSHYFPFDGVSVYTNGKFRTPLGDLDIDADFAAKLIDPQKKVTFIPRVFEKEHSVEVELPFLQETLKNFKIVPVVVGDTSLQTLEAFAGELDKAIGNRQDVLVVISSDLCHSYDYQYTAATDEVTLAALQKLPPAEIYAGLRDNKVQMCGGFPAVTALIAARALGYNTVRILSHTTTALVTGRKVKGLWTVGYAAGVIVAGK